MHELLFELGKLVVKIELSKRGSAKLLRELGGGETETILLQKFGKFWNQQRMFDRPDGLVVVTTHRLVFLTKVTTITTETDFLSFPLEMIEHLEKTRVWGMVPAIRFQVESVPFVFTLVSNSQEAVDAIERGKGMLAQRTH